MRFSKPSERVTPASMASVAVEETTLRSPEILLEALPVGVYACNRDGVLGRYNRRAADLWGWCPPIDGMAFRLAGRSVDGGDAPTREAMRTGRPVRGRKAILKRPDGSRIVIVANADPLFGQNDEVVGAVCCFQEIAETGAADNHDEVRERWFHDLLESLPAPICMTDAEGRLTFYNRAAADLTGHRPKLGIDRWCVAWRLRTADGAPLPHDQSPMAKVLKEGRPLRGIEALAERPDGTCIPIMIFPTPLRGAAGKVVGAVNMLVDISERKQAEARQNILLNELNHRVKNTLASIQSIAGQTLRSTPEPNVFVSCFETRLLAISKAHDLLARESWTGANLADIVSHELAFHTERHSKAEAVAVGGPEIMLPPRTALAVSMIVNELADNAAKHGALSAAEGAVDIHWRIIGSATRTLRFEWSESDGPSVDAPRKQGFGLRLIERSVLSDLNGWIDLDFDTAGLRCLIEIPLDACQAARADDVATISRDIAAYRTSRRSARPLTSRP